MSKFYQDFPCLAKCCLAFFGGDAKSLAWVFLARRVLPFVFGFFWAFSGGDAKSLAWVFLARQVLPFVLGFFCCLFWGRCQIPRLGAARKGPKKTKHERQHPTSFVLGFLAFFVGDAKSLAWVFLARRVLTKWMVMGSVYLELFETKPCCILVCPIIPYVLWNTIL